MKRQPLPTFKGASEFLAFAAPIICLFDCIVLPVVSVSIPFLGWHEVMHGVDDQLITVLVLGLCLPAIVPGVIKHRNAGVFMMFAGGASLMFFTNLLGENIDAMLHLALTMATSALLLRANWINRRLLTCSCSHHHREES